jgi:hypothetical protein
METGEMVELITNHCNGRNIAGSISSLADIFPWSTRYAGYVTLILYYLNFSFSFQLVSVIDLPFKK